MELWDRMAELMLRLIDEYDDQTIFLWLLVEETGFPLPLPGDLAMILAGTRAAQGKMNVFWAFFLVQLASALGASALYWLGARGGRPLLLRYGRYVNLDRDKIDRAEGWLANRQLQAVVLGRLTPGLRNVSVVAAGVFGVPYRVFLPGFLIGSSIYSLVFFSLGLWFGPQALELIAAPRLSLRMVVTIALFLALSAFLILMYRRAAPVRALAREPATETRKVETSALAGLLATVEMGLGVNVLLYALGAIGVRPPEAALLRFLEGAANRFAEGQELRFVGMMLAIVVLGGLFWGIVYSHVAVPLLRVPAWQRGLLFSFLPFGFSSLVLMPLLGAGPLGLALGAGLMPLAGEALRNAVFGVGLATSYSLLRIARQRPARAPELIG